MAGESVRERRRRGAAGRLKRLRNSDVIKAAFNPMTKRGDLPIRAVPFRKICCPDFSRKYPATATIDSFRGDRGTRPMGSQVEWDLVRSPAAKRFFVKNGLVL
jgi:hypothetical protein